MTKANVLTIPASAPFAETLARGLIARLGAKDDPLALAGATIFLPTRRAVRTLSETFARLLGGAALLPEMRPLGDVDEEEFLFDPDAEEFSLLPKIDPVRRRLLLAAMVRRWDRDAHASAMSFAQAAALARGLAEFLDEAETQGVDLQRLEDLVDSQHAQHWDEVRKFLGLLSSQWPSILKAEGAMNRAAHRNEQLRLVRERLEKMPPKGLVLAAGSTGSIPATAALLGVIARLANGMVVLPGLDKSLDAESWDNLEPGHPQYGMKQLLARMEVARDQVDVWDSTPHRAARETLMRETLRPAPTTDAWRSLAESGSTEIARGLEGLSLLEAAHPEQEALVIALALRGALETEHQTAALVTPDRNLARRVSAELNRWNIAIDDSAGRPLAKTPPGTFLCLLAEAAEAKFSPVPLLALLKHPFATCGEPAAEFRARVRELDRFALRGPQPDAGLDGVMKAIARQRQDARDEHGKTKLDALAAWFAGVAQRLKPFGDAMTAVHADLAALIELHVGAAENLADKDELWRSEAGNTAADLMADLKSAAAALPPVEPSSYPVLFRSLAEERAVRSPIGRHPRLAILGQQEARLQSFDVVVLGGLNEGTWPRAAATDPWLSRPMREKLGLEQPERSIGLAAHDFAMLAAAPRVLLTRAQKSEGAPTIASRWVQRLKQLTRGLELEQKLVSPKPYEAWARLLSEPASASPRAKPPRPRPPVEQRPRALSVTEIETWLRDPYAIYARHVLKLRPLDPLQAQIGPLERGTAVHAALEHFMREFPKHLPPDADDRLIDIANGIFRKENVPNSVLAIWRPRFERAARWFVQEERARRAGILEIHLEIEGACEFPGPAGAFRLRCRADRIDILRSGGAAIVDYKTGKPPTDRQVTMLAPQLPLEGAILAKGGFAEITARHVQSLIYIRFSGDATYGEIRSIKGDITALIAKAEAALIARIADFDDPDHPYLSRISPFRADAPGDYDHLARVREWSLTGWEGEP